VVHQLCRQLGQLFIANSANPDALAEIGIAAFTESWWPSATT
jgi:hypothetical protein